ncbi:FUSC family protein [Rubellicoccus peritrichatus]|uniref:FUSC family protein n=1 Tax=Rubellicoccus peritrichatus TaxID=3080537 RepID=A0AAQ3L6W0_9BACT|nr:FUSC family protein [Puniceicoccus sp. CR14]WOO39762.1 FUSC family protein [Puniceicoccus sp. CR14]
MLLKPKALQWVTACKASLSAVIAIGLAMLFDWDKPYWAAISTMVVTLPYVGAALEKSIMRILATVFGGFFAWFITAAFVQEQSAYLLMFVPLLIFTGYYSAGTWYPYAFLLGGITTVIVCVDSLQDPTNIWSVVYFRVSEISLGILVALAVNAIILPQSAGKALVAKIGDNLKDCAKLLKYGCETYLSDEKSLIDPQVLEDKLTGAISDLRPLILQARKDSQLVAHHQSEFDDIITRMENLLIALAVMRRAAEARFPKNFIREIEPELHNFTNALLSRLEEIGEAFRSSKVPEKADLFPIADAVDQRLEKVRHNGINSNYPIEDTTHLYAILANLNDIRIALDELADVAEHAYSARSKTPANKDTVTYKPDAIIDKRRLKHGIKVAIACVAAIYTWLWLQWPGGLQAVITTSIVIQMSVTASNSKSLLRLVGCLFGATLGAFAIVFVEPYVSSYLAFSIPLFLCFFPFAYVNFGKPAYAYAGFQAFLAFTLMTAVTNEQSVSLAAGVDRFMGILLGVIIAAVIQRLIWPVIPEHELRKDFEHFFDRAGAFLRSYTPVRLSGKAAPDALAILKGKVSPVARDAEIWLNQIAFRGEEQKAKSDARKFALAMQSLSFRMRALEQTFQRDMPAALRDRLAPQIISANDAVIESMDHLSEAFRSGNAPKKTVDFNQSTRDMSRAIHSIFRVERAGLVYSSHEVAGVLGLVRRYRSIINDAMICQDLAQEIDYKVLKRTPFF